MVPVEILENLFFIERGYLNGNHFVSCAKDLVLIDTAFQTDFARTEELVREVGADLDRVKLIVNTHCHCDHIGGNRIIQERSGCEVAMHPIGKHFINIRDDWSTWWRYYGQEADFFQCTRGLENGETISLGPHEFQVIYTPGHSADGIVLYNRKEKVLLSSDTLWETDMAVITVRVEGSSAAFSQMESFDTLEQLDVKIVYPGHGRPFTDMSGALSRARKRLREFMASPRKMGNDLLKKIVVYTLMMKNGVDEGSFFQDLMATHWFAETVDLYFEGDYRRKFDDTMKALSRRGIIKCEKQRIVTTVKR